AIAVQALHRYPFDGLVLQSTFTSLPDIARISFPRVPLHLISGRAYDTVTAVRKIDVPVLIIHGSDDETCPNWMARAIYDACSQSEKRLHVIDGGMHKDLWLRDAQKLVQVINQFAAGLTRRSRQFKEPIPPFERVVDSAFRYVLRQLRMSF